MRIVKRISDNVVLFAGPDLSLDAAGVSGAGWRAPYSATGQVVLAEADPLPYFVGNCYTHANGVWTVIPGKQADITAYYAAQAPSEAETVAAFMAAVQKYMDHTAVSFGYDDLISVISYASEPAVARYQTEGLAFRAWRSLVWKRCEVVLAEVKAGTRAVPTTAELIAQLPAAPVQG